MADLSIVTKAAVLVLVAAVFFFYGLAAGHYRLAPFNDIRALKQRLELRFAWLKGSGPYLTQRPRRQIHGPIEVVMLGDSITAGGDWDKMFPQTQVVNLGVGGDTSAGVLNRLETVIDLAPHRVFLMIGINDLIRGFPVELVQTHIQFVAQSLLDGGITPIVQGTLYTSDQKLNDKVRALNAMTRAWCTEKSIRYLDLNDVLSADGMLRPRLTDDGVHLNDEAYRLWSEVIRPYVASAQPPDR
jgi:lysophospholipase L1-like esterase